MKKYSILLFGILLYSCQNFGKLEVVTDLPKTLKEVSGTEVIANSDLVWMVNDGGNSSKLYGISLKGKIEKEVKIDSKNHDWEDITSDEKGNIYIGDFGNNDSKRKNLAVLRVNHHDLASKSIVSVEKIKFSYPNQTKYPSKKEQRFFDAEAFFYWNNYFYILTKSRVKFKYGKTSLYRISATPGSHVAEFIASFENCNQLHCWITSAAISGTGNKVALLTHHEVLVFSGFTSDNFFEGNLTRFPMYHTSQKEGISFKNDSVLYITDEKSHNRGSFLYSFYVNTTK